MTEMLLTAILALIINGLIIIGVHRSTRDGMIFGFVERWWVRGSEKAAHDEKEKRRKAFYDFSEWRKSKWPNGQDGNTYNGMSYLDAEAHCSRLYQRWMNWVGAMEETNPPAISYPLTECPVCMPSVWGAIGFAGFYLPFIPIEYAWAAIPYILALCGLMWISRSLWMEEEE